MVVGHSGCPKWLHDFIYAFHMPLFFICSGYFYKPITTTGELFTFWTKRIKGLYLPYIKWSIPFLLLHNIFYRLNIYSDSYGHMGYTSIFYSFKDILMRLKGIFLSMEGHEQLLGGFWFLRVLLFASIGYSVIDFMLQSWKNNVLKNIVVFSGLLALTIFSWYTSFAIWVFDSIFLIFYGCLFFMVGYLYKSYGLVNCLDKCWITLMCFVVVCIGAALIPTEMILVTVREAIPYMIIASAGSLLMFNIARYINRIAISETFIYVGRHTMLILALHFLSFKIVNLIKVYFYHLPPKMLSCFPVIDIHNKWFWILYVSVGVIMPLLIGYLYNILKKRLG